MSLLLLSPSPSISPCEGVQELMLANMNSCRCGYEMCFVCSAGIRNESYSHFCQHFRPFAGQSRCTECDKCDLYKEPDLETKAKLAEQEGEAFLVFLIFFIISLLCMKTLTYNLRYSSCEMAAKTRACTRSFSTRSCVRTGPRDRH